MCGSLGQPVEIDVAAAGVIPLAQRQLPLAGTRGGRGAVGGGHDAPADRLLDALHDSSWVSGRCKLGRVSPRGGAYPPGREGFGLRFVEPAFAGKERPRRRHERRRDGDGCDAGSA